MSHPLSEAARRTIRGHLIKILDAKCPQENKHNLKCGACTEVVTKEAYDEFVKNLKPAIQDIDSDSDGSIVESSLDDSVDKSTFSTEDPIFEDEDTTLAPINEDNGEDYNATIPDEVVNKVPMAIPDPISGDKVQNHTGINPVVTSNSNSSTKEVGETVQDEIFTADLSIVILAVGYPFVVGILVVVHLISIKYVKFFNI